MRQKINRVILNCKNKQFGVGSVTADQLKQGIDIWGTFTIEQSRKSSSWRELQASAELLEVVGLMNNIVSVSIQSGYQENRMREPISIHMSMNTTIMISVLKQKYFFGWMAYMDHIPLIVLHLMIQHNSRTIIRNSTPKTHRDWMPLCSTGDMIISIMCFHPQPQLVQSFNMHKNDKLSSLWCFQNGIVGLT